METSVGSGAGEGSRTFSAVREPDVRSVVSGRVRRRAATSARGLPASAVGRSRARPASSVQSRNVIRLSTLSGPPAARIPVWARAPAAAALSAATPMPAIASQRLRTPVRSAAIDAAARVSAIGR